MFVVLLAYVMVIVQKGAETRDNNIVKMSKERPEGVVKEGRGPLDGEGKPE